MSDLVSRQAVIKNAHFPMIDDAGYEVVRVNDILALPPAEPKTGEWVLEEQKSQNHVENIYICSACRNFEAWGKMELYNYCPNCGAKMGGGAE